LENCENWLLVYFVTNWQLAHYFSRFELLLFYLEDQFLFQRLFWKRIRSIMPSLSEGSGSTGLAVVLGIKNCAQSGRRGGRRHHYLMIAGCCCAHSTLVYLIEEGKAASCQLA
jgi:hypothetical protein